MALSDDDVREILRLIDESDVAELRVEIEGLSLYVLRDHPGEAAPTAASADEGADIPPVAAAPPEAAAPHDLLTVSAPMIGTFYRAEAPGAAPFVDVGSRVEATSVVCLIEVMKMMNSIHAGVAGTIVQVCVENAQVVEYGTPLFRVRPDR